MYNDQIQKFRRQELRKNQTKVEDILWQNLRNRKINSLKFNRQYGVGSYILDFFCAQVRLAIELDGSYHKNIQEYDKEREAYLKDKDIHIIRFWNEEVLKDLPNVLTIIKREAKALNAPSLVVREWPSSERSGDAERG